MKTILSLSAGLGIVASAFGQNFGTATRNDSSSNFTVKERGPHHRVWERLDYETAPDGRQIPRPRQYTELASGMHYLKDGKLEESREEIEFFGDGAIARQGPHKVIFAPNLATEGAIDLETPSGTRLRSHVLGLSYFDTESGKSVLIAEIKDCVGEIEPPNVVIYRDAFTDLEADVRYRYTRGGFEQDIILREKPAPPEDYGLIASTTRLQVLTEWVNAPAPSKSVALIDGMQDELLDFGRWHLVTGRAYSEADGPGLTLGQSSAHDSVAIKKQWLRLDGRDLLVEEVTMPSVRKQLDALPPSHASLTPAPHLKRHVASTTRMLPPKPGRPEADAPKPKMKLALAPTPSAHGFVMDYTALNGSLTNFTFKSDSTYYVTAPVYLYGTNFLEGGTVVKYTNWTGLWYQDSHLQVHGRLRFQTSPYRPAVFTAKDDNTVGETIYGSTGTPSGYYSYSPLYLVSQTDPLDIHDIRASYAAYGLRIQNPWGPVIVRDSQFCKNSTGANIDYTSVLYRNVLIYQSTWQAMESIGSLVSAENLTIHQAYRGFDYGTVSATNCLFVWVTNWTTAFTSVNNVTNNDSSTFQVVGAGAHYLATNSTNRNAGTTNINADLLAGLRQRTTYPPIVYYLQQLTNDLTLSPQAQRDTDTPDLGYHYDPLDFAFGAVWLKNATMTVQPGTALAAFAVTGNYSLALMSGSRLNCVGTPTSPIRLVRYNMSQEHANTNWDNRGPTIIGDYVGGSPIPEATFRFVDWSMAARDTWHFQS